MRLLLIHQVFTSPKDAGGTRHYELSRRLVERGHEVTIVASDSCYHTGRRKDGASGLVSEESLDGVRILRAYTYPFVHRSYLSRIISFLSFMVTSVWASWKAGPVDVVMATSPPIFQAFSTWLVAAIRRKPLLLEIRDLWPEFAIDIGLLKNPILIAIARAAERFLYWRATHLLVNSPAYRDYLLDKGIPPEKINFIPNGVDPDMFDAPKPSTIRAEYGLEGKFVALYAGALGLANDISTILQAADRLREHPDIHFVIVGDGKERSRLEAEASELGLSNVTFCGARPKRDMPGVLAAADITVATLKDIPMFRTTYPNKIFDYMAARRPVVLAIDGVIREVVEAGRGGLFVQPGDPQALADAVLYLQQRPEEVLEMGISAHRYVCAHFHRDQHAADLTELVTRMAGILPATARFPANHSSMDKVA